MKAKLQLLSNEIKSSRELLSQLIVKSISLNIMSLVIGLNTSDYLLTPKNTRPFSCKSRYSLYCDYLDDNLLQLTTYIKDFVLHFTSSLNNLDINEIIKKVLEVLGFIKHNTITSTFYSCLRTI